VKKSSALARVRTALRRVLPKVPASKMTVRAKLVTDLGVDSLKVAELSLALEDAFDRPVFLGDLFADVEDPTQITVGELAKWLENDR
jgi:acyl carrier protein